MRFDGFADLPGQELTPAGVGERATEEDAALEAIHASWRDDVERTSVMQPKFLAPAYAAARAAGVSAPKPRDYDEDGPTGTYHERDLWPVTRPTTLTPPPAERLSRTSLPLRSSGVTVKPALRYPAPSQTPRLTRNPPSHTPTRVSVAPPAPDPLPPLPAAEPRAASPKYPVPAAVWSSGSASTVPARVPTRVRVTRVSAKPAVAVPVTPPAPAYSSSPPPLPRRNTVPPPLGAVPPIPLPRPTVGARAQAPAWFSPEDYAQTVSAPPPAAVAQAPLITTPATTIFDPGLLVPTTIEQQPARWRVILEALQTRIGPWTRRRTYVLSAVVSVALVCAGSLWAWTQRPAATPAVDPGPSNAEIARILFARTGFTVITQPPGAWINVDGRPTGRITPERVSGFTPGLHAIELKLPGYYDTSLPAVLEEGSTLILPPVRLRPLRAAE
jgi:hypothetical protein